MSYYGVSVIITILITSMMAFYLLYKAKELNLGNLISISIGSIILGFTFTPAYNAILKLLSETIRLNPKLALVISLLLVLFIFLLFILIISFIISLCIPKKFSSIDCCAIIDNFMAKIDIKAGLANMKDRITVFSEKLHIKMKEIVKYVYDLKNKLKKPVDTKQIIDTMGIEKSEQSNETNQDSSSKAEAAIMESDADSMNYSDLVAAVGEDNDSVDFGDTILEEIISEESVVEVPLIEEIVPEEPVVEEPVLEELVPEEPVVEEPVLEELAPEESVVEEPVLEELVPEESVDDEPVLEEIIPEEPILQDAVSEQVIDNEQNRFEEIVVDAEYPAESEEKQKAGEDINNTAVESIDDKFAEAVGDNGFQLERESADSDAISISDADNLVLKALECKDEGNKPEAVEYYLKALQYQPDNEIVFWIVLDICAIYKQLGLSDLAKVILEGLVSEYGSVIQPEVKEEIMNNLK